MHLQAYYQNIREMEDSLPEEWVQVVSLETADGGRAGVVTEVARRAAARLIVDGKARPVVQEPPGSRGAAPASGRLQSKRKK